MNSFESTKAELRTQFLTRRRALSAKEVEQQSLQLSDRLFADPSIIECMNQSRDAGAPATEAIRVVHTFLPIQRQNEVDTWLIIRRIWQNYPEIRLAVSVTNKAAHQLTHYALTPTTLLVENRWGIPEPIPADKDQLPTACLDVVFVPLLAFDQQGHRVGYGGGFYDRFLAECRPDCLKIGLSLFEPVERIDDVEPTDIRLNFFVTPERIYKLKYPYRQLSVSQSPA